MPFIDSKITTTVAPEKKEIIKSELGKYMAVLGKSETYLMVGIEDNYDLWMGGKKLEKGAYVSVSLLGNASSEAYEKLTLFCAACTFSMISKARFDSFLSMLSWRKQ